jgi:hypothetical protein
MLFARAQPSFLSSRLRERQRKKERGREGEKREGEREKERDRERKRKRERERDKYIKCFKNVLPRIKTCVLQLMSLVG